jgi:small-conductance mechanosensitive channel
MQIATKYVRNARLWRIWIYVVIAGLAGGVGLLATAQNPKPTQPKAKGAAQNASAQKNAPPTKPAQQNAQAQESQLPPVQLDGDAVLHHLNQIIDWYRHATTEIQPVGLPSDAIYQDNLNNLAEQVVRLAFESARAQAAIIQSQQKGAANQPAGQTSQQQNLTQIETRVAGQIAQLQSQIETLNKQIAAASTKRREKLVSQRDALQGELEVQKALQDTVQKMSVFLESNGEKAGGGLEGSIDQLARSIPKVFGTNGAANTKTAPAKPPASNTNSQLTNSGGLIGEAMTLYDYMKTVHQIDGIINETDATRNSADQLRTPLRNALRATIQQSQTLGSQPPATNSQQLQAQSRTFQQLANRFKQLSAGVLPLSQEMVVLDEGKTELDEWRNSLTGESAYALRAVLVRVVGIAIALALVLVLSEVWRRITFRYVKDARRRRQFLVLRRVAIGFLVFIVLVLGFVSEFSSLATFAGFITAGIAVALQGVILSIAAYFFIVGRYGIRVGDRISVAGVTGDVVDIGLVRLYLMELAGTGLDFYPTGRIVVFSNAVLFQAGTPLFKQIPGTEYSWHEIVLMIAPEGNHKTAQDKLVAAVSEVYSKYRNQIESQHAAIERRVDIQISAPKPEARLQFADPGLELLVRYPVEIRDAPEVDEEVTRKVLDLIKSDAEVKAAVTGTPKIRSAIKG